MQNLTINRDRRVVDINTVYDPVKGIFNTLFAAAVPLFHTVNDGSPFPLKLPNLQPFFVQNIYTGQTSRSGTQLSRAQLGWVLSNAVPETTSLGRWQSRVPWP